MIRPSIEQIRQLGDVALTFRWHISMPSTPLVMKDIFERGQSLNLRATSTSKPKITDQKVTVDVRGSQVHQPAKHEYSKSIQLKCYETVDSKMADLIRQWIHWSTNYGKTYPKLDLECKILLTELDNSDKARYHYMLVGVFLEDYDFGEGSSDNGVVQPSLTLSYDYFLEGKNINSLTNPILL